MAETKIAIKNQTDIIIARKKGRDIANSLGFGSADQTRIATAISELTRNVIQHAGAEGTCSITGNNSDGLVSINVVVEDFGKGIDDIGKAMSDRFTTSNGLGAGLPGTKRLVHDFHIESAPGNTKVTVKISKRKI